MAITYHAGRRIQGTSTTVTNWVEANGTNGTGAGQYDSSNTSGDNSFNYDTTNGEIDFNVVRNSSTPNCMMKDITSSTNGLGTALSTTNWRMRFKIYWDNWEDQGDITLWLGLSSFSRSEAINGSNSNDVRKPTGGDIIGLQFTNAKLSNNCWNFVKFFYGENEDDTGRFGGDSTNHAVDLEVPNTILTSSNYNCNKPTDDTYYWCEIIRDGSTLTFNCSKTAYGNSDVCGASNSNTGKTTSGTATTTFGTTRPLKYFFVGKTGGTGETEPIQGMIRDLQIESTGSTVKPTNVQVGSRFEETDTRKIYYYNEPAFNKTGLKVYWKFDEASGAIVNQAETVGSTDSIGTGANLTVSGASYNQSNTPFNTMNFDGTNDDAVAGSSTSQFNFLHDGSKWTIAMWLENSDVTQPAVLLSDATGANTQACKVYYAGNNSSGFIGGVYDSGIWINGALGKVGLVNDAPNFIVFTFDKDESSDKYTYYKNAVEMSAINQSTSQGSSSNSAIPMYLMSQAGSDKFEGNIAEMSIWERVLTDAEITTLYNSGNGVRLADATQSATWEELGT